MTKIQGLDKVLKTLEMSAVNHGAFDGRGWFGSGETVKVTSPINGQVIARLVQASRADAAKVIGAAHEAFLRWREVPAPLRGQVVRDLGLALRGVKEALGRLVTIEMGKPLEEGLGEVQEMIDICDFACGQSRMLYGIQTHSERPRHRMFEQWHPLGAVGVISAFNFPAAVWSWNAALALICGDTVVWKPSMDTPLTAVACQKIILKVLARHKMPPAAATLLAGSGAEAGEALVSDPRVPLLSYTGSTRMGRQVGERVAKRLGRTILELGGNNAIIVTPRADLALASQNIFFGAIGTAGQRCTSTRRVIVHESVYNTIVETLKKKYDRLKPGDPLNRRFLMGPLVKLQAVEQMMEALEKVKVQGGKILWGGRRLGGCYVTPAAAAVENRLPIVQEETFAPLLYLIKYKGGVENAVAVQNDVPQGLSSSIFTNHLLEAETFLSAAGSDCGIANVNVGTSGAEIGLAFGGEKETGGGRESGSDAWKQYMRRQTNTVNWSGSTALAQGVKFD